MLAATPTGDTLRVRVGARRHTGRVRIFLARARDVVLILTGGGPALLTDWYDAIPPQAMRWLLANVARLRAEDVHEWLCDAGLCPCGVDLDVEGIAGLPAGELEAGAALAVAV